MSNLIRFTPSVDMRRLQREIDRMFDDFFPKTSGESESEQAVWAPRVDLAETEEAYLLDVEVPGIAKEDISINFQDGRLSISGDRKVKDETAGTDYVRVERSYGHFFRSFSLPKQVASDKINAVYENGVLNVTVPKTEDSKPRKIEVR